MSNILKPEAIDASQPEQLNSRVKLPQGNYVIRCKKVDFNFSRKAGNPMFVLSWEICKPETIKVAGKTYSIAGVELRKQYLTLTPEAIKRTFELQAMLGLEQRVDIDNPMEDGNKFVGAVVNAICGSDEYIKRADLTDDEIAAGKRPEDAAPLTYEDGSPVKGYTRELMQILEKSNVTVPPLATGSL